MTLLLLGMLLGAGLVLAIQELDNQRYIRKQINLRKRQDQAIALLAECTCWTQATEGEHAYYCQLNEVQS